MEEKTALRLTKKQIEAMRDATREVDSTYDLLGRLLSSAEVNSSTHAVITTNYTLTYDVAATAPGDDPPGACPTPTATKGRLRKRYDAHGPTWYQYDAFGRVTKEVPLAVTGGGSCSAGTINSHTTYEYTNNGNLSRIVYPHDRDVKYLYGTGGAKDRVSSVQIKTWNGATWSGYTTLFKSTDRIDVHIFDDVGPQSMSNNNFDLLVQSLRGGWKSADWASSNGPAWQNLSTAGTK